MIRTEKRVFALCVFALVAALAAAVSAVFAGGRGALAQTVITRTETTVYEGIVLEDAYIRDGSNAAKNYNSEAITKAHGAQYDGMGYRVINVKYKSGMEIMSLMKFALPTASEAEQADTFYLRFNVFKNADFDNGDQNYIFCYTTQTDWSETTVTWNNRPSDVVRGSQSVLGVFGIAKGDEYETKTDEEKTVRMDITEKVKELVGQGETEITVFAYAENALETSLLMHAKETSDANKVARIVGVKNTEQAPDDPPPTGNIALGKPARSNLNKAVASRVTDGDKSTYWAGTFYPAYIDVDLGCTAEIDGVSVTFPSGKSAQYSLYVSDDGKDYTRVARIREFVGSTHATTFDVPVSARIVRVYVEYIRGEDSAYLSEVEVFGRSSDENTAALRGGGLEDILGIKPYSETDYARPITDAETIENVYGLIDRTVGAKYRSWFTFELTDRDSAADFFTIEDKAGKIHICGNEGLSLATGLNHYYKNFVGVHVSEETIQGKMPDSVVPVGTKIRKQTDMSVRYAFNYCTLSYTFAFFDEVKWQRENDWLALNGVNLVLDLAGQEATWIKFLMNYGYSFDAAKDWLTGPAYYAWQFMDNMEVFGGPVPDGYIVDRVELARSTQRWKNSLGIQTVLQGYAGMVPTDFNEFYSGAAVTAQGGWNGFGRPGMIATDSAVYDEFAAKFYECQQFVYGNNNHYYAVDPFHEGGKRPTGLSDATIAANVLESLLRYDAQGVWVVQGWQSNPTSGLLNGMGEYKNSNVLIVDLIKYPVSSGKKYDKTKYGSTTLAKTEFDGTDWVWGLLANFGGNPSLHGELKTIANDVMSAKKTSRYMTGIGIISEAQYDNPVVYDLIFDLVWADESFRLDKWLDGYVMRRYGTASANARAAWDKMLKTNYNLGVRFTNEVYGMKNKGPQGYKSQSVGYNAAELEMALSLLVADYDTLKQSECYLYDVAALARQVVSNYSTMTYNDVLAAYASKNKAAFAEAKDKFLNSLAVLDAVQSTQQNQLAGEWIGKAADMGARYDDFAEDAFKMNARALITTWGSRSANRSLKDYGWRNYAGMFTDLYAKVWAYYLGELENSLDTGAAVNNRSLNDYFDLYWTWNLSDKTYSRTALNTAEDIRNAVDTVFAQCLLGGKQSENAGNYAFLKRVTANNGYDGDLRAVTDGETDARVVVRSEGFMGVTIRPELVVDLIGEFTLSQVSVVSDSAYTLYYGIDGVTWTEVTTAAVSGVTEIDHAVARYVKLRGDGATLDVTELRVYGESALPEIESLERLVSFAKTFMPSGTATALDGLRTALDAAKSALAEQAAVDELNLVYWELYDAICEFDLFAGNDLAAGKPTSAHNDPSGNSANITDGDRSTYWDSGRLSPTGMPYRDEIAPGHVVIDLGAEYDINGVYLEFADGNLWYRYEIYVGDGTDYVKVAEKTTDALPSRAVDDHEFDAVKGRYVKIVTTDIKTESDGRRAGYRITECEVRGNIDTVTNKSALVSLFNEINALDGSKYTVESFAAVKEILAAADSVIDDFSASQATVDRFYSALQAALEGLTEKPDHSGNNGDGGKPLPSQGGGSDGLSGGAIAGIVVGSVAAAAGLAAAGAFIVKRKKNK